MHESICDEDLQLGMRRTRSVEADVTTQILGLCRCLIW